jgi:CBS domain-containing protein
MKEQPPTQFAWLNIGSQGRKEQLLLTDQDNALVLKMYQKYDEVKNTFYKLAENVTNVLNVVGYNFVPLK